LRNKKDFETELLLSQGLSFKAYKTLSSPYLRIFLENGTNIKNIRCSFKATADVAVKDQIYSI